MNAYEATMKAADHIERNPQLFNFSCAIVPDCGTPGCALGWIGYFMGIEGGRSIGNAIDKLGMSDHGKQFYDRMWWVTGKNECWRDSPQMVAEKLRLYAAKYLKPEATTPDWLAIATATNAYKPAEIVT